MNNQLFSKIWIVVVFIILVGGGILAWQYLGTPNEEKITTPEKITLSEEKIVEKKVPVAASEEPEDVIVKIKEKAEKWNTIIMDEYLGYEIDYPKAWEVSADVGLVRGFSKLFEKDSETIFCSIDIAPIGREADFWGKNCEETQSDYYSRYYPNSKIENSSVVIGSSPALKIINPDFPGNITYCFGPNSTVLGKWCFEISLHTSNRKEIGSVEKRGIVVPECEEVLNYAISSFKFIEPSEKPSISEIQTGKFETNWQEINHFQERVDEGAESCLSDALETLKCRGIRYGFTSADIQNAKRIFYAASTAVAKYEVIHILDGKTYIVTIIKPVPGDGKIWTISEIQEK